MCTYDVHRFMTDIDDADFPLRVIAVAFAWCQFNCQPYLRSSSGSLLFLLLLVFSIHVMLEKEREKDKIRKCKVALAVFTFCYSCCSRSCHYRHQCYFPIFSESRMHSLTTTYFHCYYSLAALLTRSMSN